MSGGFEALIDSLPGALPGAGGRTGTKDLAVAGAAALRGGREVLRFYQKRDLRIDDGVGGPVTAADRASHAVISELLQRLRPSDPFLSEEAAGIPPRGKGTRLWIVDPLDGTKEFIQGIGEFSVMVGLAVEGSALLGAVYRPDPGILYLGIADLGAWRIGDHGAADPEPMRVATGHDSSAGLRFVRSRSHPDPRLKRIEAALEPTSILQSGSVGIKCALIAEGAADLYIHPVPHLKEWDTCAPEAVLRGAGGRVTDCRGEPLTYGKPNPVQPRGILAGTPRGWSEATAAVLEIWR